MKLTNPLNGAVRNSDAALSASRRGAFTLVELLVVIGIVAALAILQLLVLAKARYISASLLARYCLD